MIRLIADSGSTKTAWAMVWEEKGQPKVIKTATTPGLNPLYVTPDEITSALRQVLTQMGEGQPESLEFYGSGCSGERVEQVEQALRRGLTPMTRVRVCSDLVGAARALERAGGGKRQGLAASDRNGQGLAASDRNDQGLATSDRNDQGLAYNDSQGESNVASGSKGSPFIACIMGTGAIASLYDPATGQLTPMPALGYILGDEGSGAWLGRHLLGDYLKHQMPPRVREAFEEDFGPITPDEAIRHVYQMPCPNRYLATLAAFLGRHAEFGYSQELAFRGIELFWRRNVMRIDPSVREVRMVGSVAWHLRELIGMVAESHGYQVTLVLKDPIEGLV